MSVCSKFRGRGGIWGAFPGRQELVVLGVVGRWVREVGWAYGGAEDSL